MQCTPVRVPESGEAKVSAENGTSLSCRSGCVVIELRPPLGVVSGLMEIGWRRRFGCGAVVLHPAGLAGGYGMEGRAGLVVRAERQRQVLEEVGEGENEGYIYIRVRRRRGGEKKNG